MAYSNSFNKRIDPADIELGLEWRRVNTARLWSDELLILLQNDRALQLTLEECVNGWIADTPFATRIIRKPWSYSDRTAPPPFILCPQAFNEVSQQIITARDAADPVAESLHGLYLLSRNRSLIGLSARTMKQLEARCDEFWRSFLPCRDELRWVTPMDLTSSRDFAAFALHLAMRFMPECDWRILEGSNYTTILCPTHRIVFDIHTHPDRSDEAPLLRALGLKRRIWAELHEAPERLQ
jgi:hypothetical protein